MVAPPRSILVGKFRRRGHVQNMSIGLKPLWFDAAQVLRVSDLLLGTVAGECNSFCF